jgi:16S rRNA (cytidine1402-2'-O)-methyltransferase
MLGMLYLVATPIGNLQDMSFRAIETLKSVDLIACEDTRHTRKLLNHFGIRNQLISYHEHNEAERSDELAAMLEQGKSIAIVSDAGTPAICDPSFRIVQRAKEVGASIVPIPGPVAFVNAVIASGLPTDSIFFGGFLPARSGERRRRLEEIRDIPATLVFYEAPHRIAKSLTDCLDLFGDRDAAVARELTKIHEEIIRGRLSDLADRFLEGNAKGEMVLMIDRVRTETRSAETPRSVVERFNELESGGLERKAALKQAAKEFKLSRSEAYRIIISGK